MDMKSKIGITFISTLATGMLLASSGVAFAQTTQAPQGDRSGQRPPGVFGIVQSLSGTTLTVESQAPGQNAQAVTYTVNAANATVTKDGANSSVSAIATGDRVMVEGTVSGTSVTATAIRDGMMMPERGGMMRGGKGSGAQWGNGGNASSTAQHTGRADTAMPDGNGQPVVGGTVSSISGSTISITNKSNVSYTIDASNAKVYKNNATSSLAAISTGDSVLVQGSVNGTAVTASSVMNQGAQPSSASATTTLSHGMGGFLGMLGGLFHRIFGFF